MRYDPPKQDMQGWGPAEMVIGFIVCVFILGFLVAVLTGVYK